VVVVEREIPMCLIDLPEHDLRYYRNREFFELFCKDIEQNGILVPPILQTRSNGRFLVVDGVNRVRCAQKLNWKTVKCDVYEETDEKDRIIIGLRVNIKRLSHDPMGVCEAFHRLHELGMSQKEIARRFGFSKSHVSKLFALTKLHPSDKLRLAKGELTIPLAYNLVRKRRDPELMEKLGIKNKCEMCGSKVDFGHTELIQICLNCKSLLQNLLESEKRKQKHEVSQRELPL